MADIQGWLRGFQRARIPNVITPPAHLSLLDETNETAEEMHGAPSTSRMSYYQSFGRLTARSLSTESQPHLNQVEQIWHNPDPDQMAETLKVAMMTQDSFDPLRVPFNSCILHVLEAYQHMRKELIEKDCEIRDREQRHENDIKEFTQQKLRWKRKEDEYKSEMKKLEVMLATRARGLELLMLARSSSALNGTTRAKATESQQVEKESELQHVASDKEPMMSDFAERKDSFMSASFTSHRRMLNSRRNHGAVLAPQSRRPEVPIAICQPQGGTKYDSENNAKSGTARFEQLYRMARSDTSSNSLSGLKQEGERCREHYARPSRDRVSNRTYDKQAHKSVKDSSGEEEDESGLCDSKNFVTTTATHHREFSFVPGDDFGNLNFGGARIQATTPALEWEATKLISLVG